MLAEASTAADLGAAMRAVGEYRLAFWDAMLWRRTGVRILISEDFQNGQMLDGVRFIDPFAAHNSALLEQLLPR
jgi:predicted nucleic acid-binding protein